MTKYLAKITADSYAKLRDLDKYQLDLTKRTARQEDNNLFTVTGIVSDNQIEQLKSIGYKVEVLSNLHEESMNRKREVSRANRFTKAKGAANVLRSAELGGYMNVDEIETIMVNLANDHPDIISVIDLPNRTWGGRLCKAVRLKVNGNDNSNRTGILITGSMHAREWGGSDICMNFLVNLINYFLISSACLRK